MQSEREAVASLGIKGFPPGHEGSLPWGKTFVALGKKKQCPGLRGTMPWAATAVNLDDVNGINEKLVSRIKSVSERTRLYQADQITKEGATL